MQHVAYRIDPTRGSEPRKRLQERIMPAIVAILEERGLLGAIGAETLAEAIINRLVAQSPRLNARSRLLADSNGSPTCWICDLQIPMDAAEDTAECFSIDHVVPRSQGGAHMGYENLRAAHRLCNAMRDAQKPSPKLEQHLREMKLRLGSS